MDGPSEVGGESGDVGTVPPVGQLPSVVISGGQGVQVNLGGGLQVNTPAAESSAVSEDDFRSDVRALLGAVDEEACRAGLPPYLAPGADVPRMARAVRLLGRVRSPQDPGGGRAGSGHMPRREDVYALPAERDDRAGESLQPWEQAMAGNDRLVVLADPGMGKSWLLRLEAHRLASAALAVLDGPAAVSDVAVPVLVRADVLAAAPGRTLAEAAARYLAGAGLLAARSEGRMRELIAGGGAVLLVDALDEVPREAVTAGGQAPCKRLEDLLGQWAERCPGRARFVVASRLAGYTALPVPGAREAELLPFTPADIDAAARAWELSAQASGWLLGQLGDPAVAGMARVPLLLALTCSLAADPHHRQQDLPRTRAALYGAVVWQFLSGAHRASEHGAPAAALDQATRQALLSVLTRVAVTFAGTSRGWVDRMPRGELLDAIRGAGDAVADLGGSPAAVLDQLAGRAGVLVPAGNPAGGEQDYVFLHRTIAEYLVARHLRDLPGRARMAIIAEHQWFDPDWAEVIPMLGGLLPPNEPDGAHALVSHFLAERPDPLHHAFLTALRILKDVPDPDRILTSGQASQLTRKIRRVIAKPAGRGMLPRALASTTAWPRPVTTALLSLVTDRSRGVRRAAAGALAGCGAPEVTRALLGLVTDRSRGVRRAAAGALAGRGAPEVTRALLSLVTDRSRGVRYAAAGALAGRGAPEVTAAFIARLHDRDKGIRRVAVHALKERDAPQVTTALLASLNDRDWYVRSLVADALRMRDTPEVATALASFNDRDWRVRGAAADALEGGDAPEVTTALLASLSDRDTEIRRAAVGALAGRETPEVTTALLASLNDRYWYVRRAAVGALAGRDTPEVTAAILTCLNDRNSYVRGAAADVLERCNAPEVTAAFIARLNDRYWYVRRTAVGALAGRDTPEVTAAILARLNDRSWYVRSAAAYALEGRDEAAILLRLAGLRIWLARPATLRERFDLASTIADRLYLRIPPASRARVRQRLGNITRRV